MFSVGVLGTSSAVPAYGRFPTAQMVQHYERLFLIDCGEGTQFHAQRYHFRLRNLDAVFVSHMHGDHVYGLPGLLTSMSIFSRTTPLLLVGPQGIAEWLKVTFKLGDTYLQFPLEIKELPNKYDAPVPVFENSRLVVSAFPLHHRIPTHGYRFQEKPKYPRFLADRARQDDVPKEFFHLLKQGNDVTLPDGRQLSSADYVGTADPAYAYAFCSDTAYHPAVVPHIAGVDLLYHEATFTQDLAARAKDTGHSTTLQAAEIARAAQVRHLLLGHFSARYKHLDPLLHEARSVFPDASLAIDGRNYPVAQPLLSVPL